MSEEVLHTGDGLTSTEMLALAALVATKGEAPKTLPATLDLPSLNAMKCSPLWGPHLRRFASAIFAAPDEAPVPAAIERSEADRNVYRYRQLIKWNLLR